MLLFILPFTLLCAEEVTIGEITYSIDYTTTTATVTLSEPTNGDIVVPSYITVEDIDYPVVGINDYAFSYCSVITSIVIPEGVTFIGHWAFNYCINLTSATLPSSILSIGNHAFYKCDELLAIDLPDELETIGNEVFYKCLSLTYVDFPTHLTSLGDYAFAGCTGITTFEIPQGLTAIGEAAFSSCSNLATIEVSPLNESYTSVDGVLFSKDTTTLIAYPVGITSDSYMPPATTRIIDNYAFYDCLHLSSLLLHTDVSAIGAYAFSNCSNLATLTLPDEGLSSIGEYAFSNCTTLDNVVLPEGVTELTCNLFEGCENLANVGLPETLEVLGEYAFANCLSLSSIEIPAAVYEIAYYAFDGCTSLQSFEVDTLNSVYYTLDDVLFCKEDSVLYVYPAGKIDVSYTVPSVTTAIAGCAFAYCYNLETVVLPQRIAAIESYAFYHCENLAHVYNEQEEPLSIATNTFFKLADEATLYVPTGSIALYEVATGWSKFDYIVGVETDMDALVCTDEAFRVISSLGSIHVIGAEVGALISIYNVSGGLLHRARASEGVTTLPISKGMYIVQVAREQGVSVIVR